MKSPLMIIAGALITSLVCIPALAQTAEDRELAQKICADQSGSALKICVNQQLRNFDCTNAGNRQQCEARKRASRQCAGLFGWDFRQCTQRMIPGDRLQHLAGERAPAVRTQSECVCRLFEKIRRRTHELPAQAFQRTVINDYRGRRHAAFLSFPAG